MSSSTEATDSDEAQRATTAIVQRLVEKQVQKETKEEKLSSLVDEQETLMTKDQIEQKLSKKRDARKSSSSPDSEMDLDDSEITFKSINSDINESSRVALSEELDDTVKWEKKIPVKDLQWKRRRKLQKILW